MKLVNTITVLASIFAGLLACELILRIIEPENVGALQISQSTPNGTYSVLMPGATGERADGKVTVNAAGYRGKYYPAERKATVRRIMVFGDSHTMGTGADDDATYPAVVEQLLVGDFSVQVLNFGVGGHDLRQIIAYIKDSVPIYKPEFVIVTFHAGDILSSGDFILHTKEKLRPQSVGILYAIKQYLMHTSYLARFLIPYGAEYLRMLSGSAPGIIDREYQVVARNGLQWRISKDKILTVLEFLHQRNADLLFVLFPSMISFENHPAKELHNIIGKWLRNNDIKYLDLIPYYRGYEASNLHATLLDKHPNELGYDIAGRAVAEWLQGFLVDRRSAIRPAAEAD